MATPFFLIWGLSLVAERLAIVNIMSILSVKTSCDIRLALRNFARIFSV